MADKKAAPNDDIGSCDMLYLLGLGEAGFDALGDAEGLAADGLAEALAEALGEALAEAFAGALAEADGFGEALGLGDGVVPVGVQPVRSAAAMTIESVSAISFFMKQISLH